MGSDYALNPPQPVWEWEDYELEDDALLAISVAFENNWKVQAFKNGDTAFRVGIHTGKYI
jgi:hypothetical protein